MSNITPNPTSKLNTTNPEQMAILTLILLTKLEIKKYGGFLINIKKLNKQIDDYNARFNENLAKIPEQVYCQFKN
jgi:hypothetical protein